MTGAPTPLLTRVARKPHGAAPGGADPFASGRFPFTVPAVRALTTLDTSAPVTFFVGENGSGKSTLLEAIAAAAELPTLGSDEVARDGTLAAQRELAAALRLSWTRRTRRGFFLRAEDFFGYLRREARTDARLERELREAAGLPSATAAPDATDHPDEVAGAAYIELYDARSHGESFFELFRSRVRPECLYLLDEPESPLSPQRQLAFLALLADAARAGAQFIIATHSPILLALPGARIYSFDESPIREVAFEELDHVRLTRDFLNDPERYLRHLR